MKNYILFVVIVPVISYTTRDCWDRYPEEWAYFRNVYTRMYNTDNSLEDVMNCVKWTYTKSWYITLSSQGLQMMNDVCQLCTDFGECLEGRGKLLDEPKANSKTIYKKCRVICREVTKSHTGPESWEYWPAGKATTPRSMARDHIKNHICSPKYLYVKQTGNKGRGLFTKVNIPKRSYVVYYNGKRSSDRPRRGKYAFSVKADHQTVWFDAEEEDGSFGRLLNDDHVSPNLKPRHIKVDAELYLVFYAVRDIMAGEELSFDYGCDSGYSWRAPVPKGKKKKRASRMMEVVKNFIDDYAQ